MVRGLSASEVMARACARLWEEVRIHFIHDGWTLLVICMLMCVILAQHLCYSVDVQAAAAHAVALHEQTSYALLQTYDMANKMQTLIAAVDVIANELRAMQAKMLNVTQTLQ